ncbi:helix-turn-helix transcriptional regulator [Nonomuraea spiralis]|uniref:helix-turn-helix transcriptional regulator n=1 Tax=Nonomuraea TaxID=83681 RepID=UPI00163D25E9|nr:AraC family transcriptional regulator [Nonomuraea sp. WAC 01424]
MLAIANMNERLAEPLELRDHAQTAHMSLFHFHRTFHTITTTTPGRFLTALRIAEAKQMLVRTSTSILDISISVGYSSLGTFTSQFTRLVGLSPGRFRSQARKVADVPVIELMNVNRAPQPDSSPLHLECWVRERPDRAPGLTVIGLFPSHIAQTRPISCTVTTSPGPILVPVSRSSAKVVVLAISMAAEATVEQVLMETSEASMYVGRGSDMTLGDHISSSEVVYIQLRKRQLTDPPLLTAFPLLAQEGISPEQTSDRSPSTSFADSP